ncbi:MAG: DUF2189 domain-containing protein [Alphaproteobacteria bacterium]
MSDVVSVFVGPSPKVRAIGLDRPWAWLAAGWRDLLAAPGIGLVYGAIFSGAGFLMTVGAWLVGLSYLVMPLLAGFMLVAPILAVGLYEVSRRLEAGQPTALAPALTAWRANRTQIALLGVLLMLFLLAWIRFATLLFALFFSKSPPGLDDFLLQVLNSANGLSFLVVGTLIGAGLAALVFAISAVSVPMLLDQQTNVFAAVATSFVAVRHNLRPMGLWAILIVIFTGLGLATFFIGLIVALPLIGHATWHAYRDLVLPMPASDAAKPL